MYKIVIAIVLFVVILGLGIGEQIFINNSFNDLKKDCQEIQKLLLDGDYEGAYEKTEHVERDWRKERDLLEFACPNTDIKDIAKEIGELKGSQIAEMYDDSVTRCEVLIAMAENSRNLLAYKWKNVL